MHTFHTAALPLTRRPSTPGLAPSAKPPFRTDTSLCAGRRGVASLEVKPALDAAELARLVLVLRVAARAEDRAPALAPA